VAFSGDEIRATWIRRLGGYDALHVDQLLLEIAAELDAGRSAAPLIDGAAFGPAGRGPGYDKDAVDWFLGHLRRQGGEPDPGWTSADPWHDLGMVAQLAVASSPQRPVAPWHYEATGTAVTPGPLLDHDWARNSAELAAAQRRFGELPGAQLRCRLGFTRNELTTAGQQQPLATWRKQSSGPGNPLDRFFPFDVVVGGQRYRRRNAGPADPAYTQLEARSLRDETGHFLDAAVTRGYRLKRNPLLAFADQAGNPVLYVTGENYCGQASARITLVDQRSLRFLVRGQRPANAIMTAVDESGVNVARYRDASLRPFRPIPMDIIVNPDWPLTDELVLALAVSAEWLKGYFDEPGGGG